jgi:putative flavoprotein involved in K+ transport
MNELNIPNYDTLIIGAGQAGLSAGYYLKKLGQRFAIFTKDQRIGDNWRRRWGSLKLFTPAYYNKLPGMSFPSNDPNYLPDKNETADFLETYAHKFGLPVNLDTEVIKIEGDQRSFVIKTLTNSYTSRSVIIATGAFHNPRVPNFSKDFRSAIFQIHSSGYSNPSQLSKGDVLVVGAGSSGLQIAAEIAEQNNPGRKIWLSGPNTGTFPRQILGIDIYHFFAHTVFLIPTKSLSGKIIKAVSYRHGDLVLRPTYKKMIKAGVKRVGRTVGIKNNLPLLDNGNTLEVKNIVWCTGFRPDFKWIDLDIFDRNGYPLHNRGVIKKLPRIYFLGLHFQYTISSSLLGGVGKDAEYITDYIANNP